MSLSKLYPTVNPTLFLDFANTRALDPRISFVRSTTATYYDGVTTAKAEQNLLTFSQQFDSWSPVGVTVTANTVATTAPDGTSTADLVIPSVVDTPHGVSQTYISPAALTYGISVYAKAGGYNYLGFADAHSGSIGRTVFDLTAGTITQNTTGTATITSVGNGWYRCTVIAPDDGQLTLRFMVLNVSAMTSAFGILPTFAGDGTSGIYLWGAQLEQRSAVTAYTATTSAAITNYIPTLITAPANTARFDYNPVTSVALGLLIEELRTNFVIYSSQFDNAAWSKTNATVTSNTIVAPDGTLTGDRLVEDTNNGVHRVFSSLISTTAGTAYTGSCYAKAGERTRVAIELRAAVALGTITFDLSNGTVVNSVSGFTASIQNVGNGWYRCSATAGTTITTTGSGIIIIYLDNGSTTLYTGNGYAGLFIWGSQVEAGGFATSYIATVATTQSREADVATMTGTNLSSWFNANEGTVVASFTTASPYTAAQGVAVSRFPTPFNFTFNSTGVTNVLWYGIGAELYINSVYNNVGTVAQGPNTFVLSVATTGGQSRTALNGSTATNRTGTQIGSTVNSLAVGGLGGGSALNGTLRRLYYYPFSITATQIQSLSQ